MKYYEADKIAQDVVALLHHYCDKILVCGGLRRGKDEVHDLDIVIAPDEEKTAPLFGGKHIEDVLEPIAELHQIERHRMVNGKSEKYSITGKWDLNGAAIKKFQYKGISVEVNIANGIDRHFDTLILIKTGSLEFNKCLAHFAKLRGLTLHASGAGLCELNHWEAAGREYNAEKCKIIATGEREIIEKLLGKYYEPENREKWAMPESILQQQQVEKDKQTEEIVKREGNFYIKCPCGVVWKDSGAWDNHKAIRHPAPENKIRK